MIKSKWLGLAGFLFILGASYPLSYTISRRRPPCHFIIVACRELGLVKADSPRDLKSKTCITPALRDGRLGNQVFEPTLLKACQEAREISRGRK